LDLSAEPRVSRRYEGMTPVTVHENGMANRPNAGKSCLVLSVISEKKKSALTNALDAAVDRQRRSPGH
jgi:hypothetical protein